MNSIYEEKNIFFNAWLLNNSYDLMKLHNICKANVWYIWKTLFKFVVVLQLVWGPSAIGVDTTVQIKIQGRWTIWHQIENVNDCVLLEFRLFYMHIRTHSRILNLKMWVGNDTLAIVLDFQN